MLYRRYNQTKKVTKDKINHALTNYRKKLVFTINHAETNVIETVYKRSLINLANRKFRDFKVFKTKDEIMDLYTKYNSILHKIPLHYLFDDQINWKYLLPIYYNEHQKNSQYIEKNVHARKNNIRLNKFQKKSSDPLASIIIPVYNVSEFIDECLSSIRMQSYENLEIICVNDASPDKSTEIINRHMNEDSRIRIISHTKNIGLPSSRNSGLKEASGKYIFFIDGDDTLYNQESIASLLHEGEQYNADIVIGGALKHYYQENAVTMPYYKRFLQKKYILHTPLEFPQVFSSIAVWNKLYNRSFLIDNHCLLFNPRLRGREDNSYTPKTLCSSKKTVIYPFTTYLYRQDSSTEYVEKAYRKVHFKLIAIEELFLFFEENPDLDYMRTFFEPLCADELITIASRIPREQLPTPWLHDLLRGFGDIFNRLPPSSYKKLPEVAQQAHSYIKKKNYEKSWQILATKKQNSQANEMKFPLLDAQLRFPRAFL